MAALVAVPIAWGTYGSAVKLAYALPEVPPSPILQLSFSVVSFAGLFLAAALADGGGVRESAAGEAEDAPGAPSAAAQPDAVRAGLELGLYLFLGASIQLQGLQRTDAARAGFLVQLTTVLVPLVESALLGRRLPPQLLGACGAATLGIGLISAESLSGSGSGDPLGDALVATSALLYTAHVIRLGECASAIAPLRLARAKAGAQVGYGTITALSLTLSGGFDAPAYVSSASSADLAVLAGVALWIGLIPSAFTTWAQSYGQAAVPPSAANVLYSLQPVWTALIAWLVLGEALALPEAIGGACIVVASLLATTQPPTDGGGGETGPPDDGSDDDPRRGRSVGALSAAAPSTAREG